MKNLKKGSGDNVLFYPLTIEQLEALTPCDLVNPKVGKNFGLKIPTDFDIEEAASEVLKVRMETVKGIMPWWFMEKYWPFNFEMPRYLPKAFEISGLSFEDTDGLADVVHMDDPLDLPLAQKKCLTNPKYGGTANIKKHIPEYKQFLETVIDTNETITDFQKRYGHEIFEMKSYFGLARPEEVIDSLGALMTAYPEGCPCHGESGQGHGAIALAGFKALNNDLDLTDEQVKNGLYESYLWGQFRCMAGVHYGIAVVLSILLVWKKNKFINKDFVKKFII